MLVALAVAITTVAGLTAASYSAQARGAERTVPITWEQQPTYCTCGPTGLHMVLAGKLDKKAPKMSQLQSDTGTRSCARGETNRDEAAAALNKYLRGKITIGYRFGTWDREKFMGRLTHRVDKDKLATMVAVVINKGGFRPPNYPNRSIQHWLVVAGYDGRNRVLVYDPTAGARFKGGGDYRTVPHSYWLSINDLSKIATAYVA